MSSAQLLVGDVISVSAARTPDRPAIALGEQSLTFAELDQASSDMADRLRAAGVVHGDRVAWWAETSIEAAVLYFATAKIGAIFTPLNPRYTDEEAAQVIGHAEPRVLLTDDGRGGGMTLSDLPPASAAPAMSWRVDENDAHVIFYTSGTTGEPKGCILSHRTERLRAGPGARWPRGATLCMFPQFHMAGWSFTLDTWLSSSCMVYVERADAPDLLAAIDRHGVQQLYCVPAVWRRILDHDRSGYDLSSLTQVDTGTSATTPEFLRELQAAFPKAEISVAYGSTEAQLVCMLGPDDLARKAGTVGLPAPGVEVRIAEDGELWAKSPYLFSGYFRNPAATDAALVDGWYRTGDLAVRDEDGCYAIVGRAKEIIRTGGETVSPVEVDLVLQAHPAVLDAAVAGEPHDDWGEIITAYVVLKPGAELTLETLRAHCAGRLAPHKHPRRLVTTSAIPRTGATRQVQRARLRAVQPAEPAGPD